MRRRPPRSPLFPYTTLFRSLQGPELGRQRARGGLEQVRQIDVIGAEAHAVFAQHGARALVEPFDVRSEEHTSELQSHSDLVCRLLLEKNSVIVDMLEAGGVL